MNSSSPDFWNERYGTSDYAYGIVPNEFLRDELENHPKGRILLPAEGEGRNAVFAAVKGWEVTAFDFSEKGKEKAEQLAKMWDMKIDYKVASYDEFEGEKESFDCLALIYAHIHESVRKKVHKKLLRMLKPDGVLIFEAFSKKQLGRDSGGPKSAELLFDTDDLRKDFRKLSEVRVWEETVSLTEGKFHEGEAIVVRAIGKK